MLTLSVLMHCSSFSDSKLHYSLGDPWSFTFCLALLSLQSLEPSAGPSAAAVTGAEMTESFSFGTRKLRDQSAGVGHQVYFGYRSPCRETQVNYRPQEPYGNSFPATMYVHPGRQKKMSPERICFTQACILNGFRSGESIVDTMEALKSGVLRASDIPEIQVFQRSMWYPKNNWRLWCFKSAGLSSTDVCMS